MRKYIKTLICGLGITAVLWGSPSYAQDEAPTDPVVEAPAAAPADVPDPKPDVEPPVEPEVEVAEGHAPAATQTALSKLVDQVMGILIPAFLALIGALIAFILNWVRKKFKLNVSDQQIGAWSLIALKAASRAAEWARAKAKGAADGKKIPGPEVLEVAVDWAVEMGIAFSLPEIGREKLIGLIESELFDTRTDAP